jgi:hypothetical protein
MSARMRVLLLSNSGTERCGVAQYGRHLIEAANVTGHDVEDYDASYPRTVPTWAKAYDVIHVNWHAATVGHLTPDMFPPGVPVTLFLHEPAHICPLEQIAKVLFSTEKPEREHGGNFVLFPHPCPLYVPQTRWTLDEYGWRIGLTGIRRDGAEWVESAVAAQNAELLAQDGPLEPGEVHPGAWSLSESARNPDGWLSDEGELERLASCALVVHHYHSNYSGQSYGVMMSVAAGRPILLNTCRMLQNLLAEPELYVEDDVAAGIEQVIRDIRDRKERRPIRLWDSRRWDRRFMDLVQVWGRV